MNKRRIILLLLLASILLTCCGKEEKQGFILSPASCAANTLKEEDLILPDFNIKLSFTGDMMLAADKYNTRSDNFNYYARNYPKEYFLDKVRYIFEEDDFTTVNLENVFTNRDLAARDKGGGRAFWFKSATKNVEILTCSSVEGVSLANNHTEDFGEQGYLDTVETVKNAGLHYGIEDQIIYYEKNGFRIAVVCHGLWGEWQADEVIRYIDAAEENSDYQIVFYHGGTEGVYEPEEWRIRASRKLVDHGADLIIGNHPHVLQPREVYRGAEIIYSMGNFCYGGHSQPRNRTMIYQMELTVNPMNKEVKNQQSTIIPCYVYTGGGNNNFQPAVIEDEWEKQKVLDFMDGLRSTPQ